MTTEITIEKNVPMPPHGRKGSKYPWHKMEVGDSFICPGRFGYETARTATLRFKPKRFRASIEPSGGFRIWRVE